MLKYASYNIVFQEVPGETTLALNLSRCPYRCMGCHSTDLQKDIGEILEENTLIELMDKYQNGITCICFMGGDNCPPRIEELAMFIKEYSSNRLKTAWYSGNSDLPADFNYSCMDFIKLGPYMEKRGALNSPTTNQRFYKVIEGKMTDNTHLFAKKLVGMAI